MVFKIPKGTFESVIKIRNYVVSIILGDEYFSPLFDCFDGHYSVDSGVVGGYSPGFIRQLNVDEVFVRQYIREHGLLADFIDPANVPWLPDNFIIHAINSICSFELKAVSPLTFLAYANLTSMLGIQLLYDLDGNSQCLTCHRDAVACECIVHKFRYLQRLNCRCGLLRQRMCHCNGIPAMIRDLDEFSIILDSIIYNIFGIDSQGGIQRMRFCSKGCVWTKRISWRQATRNGLSCSGKSHVAAWDFRPP